MAMHIVHILSCKYFLDLFFGVEVDYKAALGKLFLAFVWFGFWSVQNVKIKVINIQLGS